MNLTPQDAQRLAGVLLEEEPGDAALEDHQLPVGPFSRYRITRLVGVGGMGEVYEAQQDNPDRRVAIKVIRPDRVSPDLLRRFEHETRILARLQHPGIAPIYEAGQAPTPSGPMPFFAMEYVDGRPLTAHATDSNLPLRSRLDLFLLVCDAVAHAHRKGIIHRDLKPANILIDARGQPRILDFGIARATDSDIRTTTMHTEVGKLIGTLPYMSPEQAGGDPDELDTRSDVYSLGVILYELLSGRPPFDFSTPGQRLIPQALRAILETEPAKLSSISRVYRGDLETIVGKALAKEKERRYQSVAELAGDVRRHLSDEPITARRPSAWHQLTRFARRNRALAISITAAATLLVAGVVTCLFLIAGQSAALAELRLAREAESRQTAAAEGAKARAIAESQIARAVTDFLEQMLNSVDPARNGRDVRVVEVLKNAQQLVSSQLGAQPETAGQVLITLSKMYHALGQPKDALRAVREAHQVLEAALGPDHRATLNSLGDLAGIVYSNGDLAESLELLEPVYQRQAALLGPDDPDTLTTANTRGVILAAMGRRLEAETCARDTVDRSIRVLGANHHDTLQRQGNLATILMGLERWEDARVILESLVIAETRILGIDHPETLQAMGYLAGVFRHLGRPSDAEPLLRESVDRQARVLGERHPQTLSGMNNLAVLLSSSGRNDEALPVLERSLALHRDVFGPDNAYTLNVESTWAVLMEKLSRSAEAEEAYRHVFAARRKSLGETHPNTLRSGYHLGGFLRQVGKAAEAVTILETVVNQAASLEPKGAYQAAVYGIELGEALRSLGDHERSERRLLSSYSILCQEQGSTGERALQAARALAALYEQWGKTEKAAEYRALLPASPTSTGH